MKGDNFGLSIDYGKALRIRENSEFLKSVGFEGKIDLSEMVNINTSSEDKVIIYSTSMEEDCGYVIAKYSSKNLKNKEYKSSINFIITRSILGHFAKSKKIAINKIAKKLVEDDLITPSIIELYRIRQ